MTWGINLVLFAGVIVYLVAALALPAFPEEAAPPAP